MIAQWEFDSLKVPHWNAAQVNIRSSKVFLTQSVMTDDIVTGWRGLKIVHCWKLMGGLCSAVDFSEQTVIYAE